MRLRKSLALLLLAIALALIAWGLGRGEPSRIYMNARAVCYSCIGLE